MGDQLFVPADFAVPGGLTAGEFRLEPLGPQHNAADYAAWTASIGHIRATPGFAGSGWPHEMTPAENLDDLERHARDFAGRRGFTYTVLSAAGEVSRVCAARVRRRPRTAGRRPRRLAALSTRGSAERPAPAGGGCYRPA
jgi:hypothetical protein